jgi:hypothetical protein
MHFLNGLKFKKQTYALLLVPFQIAAAKLALEWEVL